VAEILVALVAADTRIGKAEYNALQLLVAPVVLRTWVEVADLVLG